jgi:ATP-binding cassette subfamily B protein
VGGTKTLTLAITPGDLVAFISYLGLLTWPMMAMGWVTNLIQRGKASLERLDAVLSEVPEIRDAPDARPAPASPGVIRLDGVGFTYAGAPAPALTGIDLSLRTGEMLGIVGPPGSGKSTLLALLPRIYDVGAGTIRMDGVDIRDIRLADLRSRISLCPQEPFLFSGTVRENITLNAEVDGDRLMDAVRRARLVETVAGFPRGLDTVVGERGVILSGGQKQRIALARLFVRPAPVLLLDDPVSQVDSATAAGILDGIEALRQTATLVMVSHRIAAVHGADRVVVLDRGRIAEAGPPKVLAAAEGYYARMHRMQTAEEAGEDVAEGLGLF